MNKLKLVMLAIGLAIGSAACSQGGDNGKAEAPAQPAAAAQQQAPAKMDNMMAEPAKVVEEKVAQVEEKAAEMKEKVVAETDKAVAQAEQMTKSASSTMAVAEEMPQTKPAPMVQEMAMGDAAKGAKITKGKCGGCHALDSDRKKVGPTLMGIYGKKPTIDGIPYATWDAEALDAWIKRPKDVKPRTRMAFSGISDEGKRQDIIAYLKTL